MPVLRAASSGRWPGSTPNSPSTLGAVMDCTVSRSATPSGVRISSSRVPSAIGSGGFLELLRRGLHVLDAALQVEGLLGHVVERAGEDLLERRDGVLQGDVLTLK